MSFQLATFDIAKAPPFSALSYTWGPSCKDFGSDLPEPTPTFPAEILCNGQPYYITQSLFDALCYLKGLISTEFIWIDGICINQNDNLERSSQVLLMRKIYSFAKEVTIWLGNPVPGLKDLVWLTQSCYPGLMEMEKQCGGKTLRTGATLWDPRLHRAVGSPPDFLTQLTNASKSVGTYRYFSRAWVTQEIVLARHLRMFCGHVELSWENLGKLAVFFHESDWGARLNGTLVSELNENDRWLAILTLVSRLQSLRTFVQQASSSEIVSQASRMSAIFNGAKTDIDRSFGWLFLNLLTTRFVDCADKRDKVFSMLGIAEKLFGGQFDQHIQPNYELSPEEVFLDVMTKIVAHSPRLDVLSAAGVPAADISSLDIPSWVPDWSIGRLQSPLAFIHHFDVSFCRKSSQFPRSIVGSEFNCLGAKCGTVDEVCAQSLANLIENSAIIAVLQFCSLLQPRGYASRFELMWRAFISDTMGTECPAPAALGISAQAALAMLVAFNLCEEGDSENTHTFERLETILIRLNEGSESIDQMLQLEHVKRYYQFMQIEEQAPLIEGDVVASPYIGAWKIRTPGRRLYTTTQGILCTGPETVQAGDQVWLLRDCRLPYILRPTPSPSKHLLVGECYVHRYMHGEMLRGPQSLEHEIGPITLV
jgi:hypothetical protein